MTLQTVQSLRLAFGVWGAVAVSYGVSWQLSFVAPIFATIFLLMPAWIFHRLIPNSLAGEIGQEVAEKKPETPPLPAREIRVEQALMSTTVALSAVIIFFMFNLSAYAFAMIQICFMVGAPDANSSFAAMKANALACCIGGAVIIVVFNLLVAVPTYPFLLALCLLVFLQKQRPADDGKEDSEERCCQTKQNIEKRRCREGDTDHQG